MKPCLSLLVALFVCQAGTVSAQSLAEVARRERARRENLHKPKANKPKPAHTNVGAARSEKKQDEVAESESDVPERIETTHVTEAPQVIPARYEPLASLSIEEPVVISPSAPGREETLQSGYALLASSEHVAAADVFLGMLRTDPSDREARLGLARVYVRSGNHGAGRRELETLLVSSPSDAEAMVAIAQSYQWSGVAPMAREWYEKALVVEPGREDALIGLGHVELWNEPVMAAERSRQLEASFPGSSNVRALQDEAQKARAPEAHVSFDYLTDSNQNEIGTTWLEGSFGLSSGWDLWVGGARFDMSYVGPDGLGAPGTGSITSIYSGIGRQTGPGRRVDFRLGMDYRKDTLGATDYVPIGGAAWSWGLDRKWSGRFSFDRDSFRYTTEALDQGIVLNAFTTTVSNRFAADWIVDGELGYWDIENRLGIDNSRFSAGAGLRYKRLFGGKVPFEAGYNFQYFTYEETFGAGFFSPSFYRGHRFEAGVAGPIGRLFDYYVRGTTGVQSWDNVSHEPLWSVRGSFGLRLGEQYKLEVFGNRGDNLAFSDFPVTTEQFGLRIRWLGAR